MSRSETTHLTPRLPPRRVLEDASGRRLQRMRWFGRAVALLFLIWLTIVILGGLGVGPAGRLPLGHVLRASAGPPPVRKLPAPVAPSAADLAPALPAPVAASPRATTRTASPGKSAVAPGQTKTKTTTTTSPGKSAVAPGQTKTTTSAGKSAVAPGRTKTTTTATTTTATAPGKGLGRGKKP